MNSYTGHFWSLGVEWQFYLLWPFVVFLAPRRALPWVLAGALIVGILCAYPPQLIVDRTNFLPSLDSLAIGGLLGYARHRGMNTDWLKRLAWPLIAFSFSSVLVYLLSYKPLQGVIDMPCFEALYVGFAGLICRAEDHDGGRAGRMLDWRPAQYVGRISYGAYVFHNFVLIFYFQMCWRFGVKPLDPGAPLFLLVLVLTLAAAAVSWELVERPINAFRTRFAYPPRQSPGAVAEAAQAG
jgi:peptidoglycan/LPS O-acetylase OafA/YrhL